jgi:hypothetical protein
MGFPDPGSLRSKKRAVPEGTAKFREETSKNVQRNPPYGPDIGAGSGLCKIFFCSAAKWRFAISTRSFLAYFLV